MVKGHDIHVIGGGIVGLLCARDLMQRGERVVLFDHHEIGKDTSWAGGGILSPLYPWRSPPEISSLAKLSQSIYPELTKSLMLKTGIDPEWQRCGMLVLDPNEIDIAVKWAKIESISLEIVDITSVFRIQAGIPISGDRVIYLPDINQVRNPYLVAALKQELLLLGCEIHENEPVLSLTCIDNQLKSVKTNKSTYASKCCIVTAGAWTSNLLRGLGLSLDIKPVLGQMLLMRGEAGLLKTVLLSDHHYLIPRLDGHILIGSTLEHTGFSKRITSDAEQLLMNVASEMFPQISQCTKEKQWAGLRPSTPTEIPYISKVPSCEGLVVCAGHYRNGFALGPASAQLAVDLVLDGEPVVDPEPYSLNVD